MIAPAWLRNRTQPIAVADVLEYLAQAGERPESAGREIQIGGAGRGDLRRTCST